MDRQLYIFLLLMITAVALIAFVMIVFSAYKRRSVISGFSHNKDNASSKKWWGLKDVSFSQLLTTNVDEAQQRFVAAGFYDFSYARFYMPVKIVGFALGVVGIVLYHRAHPLAMETLVIAISSIALVCIVAPDWYLNYRKKWLLNKISNQLPYLLDLMAVCVQTGMTIESSMSYLAQEMKGFDRHLAQMLRRTNERSRVVGLEQALDELYTSVPSNPMRSFVMTLKQSLQYGSSIYQVLTGLAADIREVKMLELEEKIGKLSAKMSIPLIVFIMIPLVILIAAPGVMRMMSNA
ncbi:type II secretion system F family protein [Vibrio paucivorans]